MTKNNIESYIKRNSDKENYYGRKDDTKLRKCNLDQNTTMQNDTVIRKYSKRNRVALRSKTHKNSEIPHEYTKQVDADNKNFDKKNYERILVAKRQQIPDKKDTLHRKTRRKIINDNERLDTRQLGIVFDDKGHAYPEKVHFADVQVNSFNPEYNIANINNCDSSNDNLHAHHRQANEIDEKFILNKHILLIEAKYSVNLYKIIKQVLAHSYCDNFGDIHFFTVDNVDVVLRGPFVLSKSICKKFNLHLSDRMRVKKHLWVLDCPKTRYLLQDENFQENGFKTGPVANEKCFVSKIDFQGNLEEKILKQKSFKSDDFKKPVKCPEFLQNDPYVLAFGYPPPESAELEGINVLDKVARFCNGNLISCDTGKVFNSNTVQTNFTWRVNSIIPPDRINKILEELFTNSVHKNFVRNSPTIYDMNLKDMDKGRFILENMNSLNRDLVEKIIYDLKVDFPFQNVDYLLKNIKWKFVKNLLSNSVFSDTNNIHDLSNNLNKKSLNTCISSVDEGICNDWTHGYSFVADFGIGSKISIEAYGEADSQYRQNAGKENCFEYRFQWLPKNINALCSTFSPSLLREQNIGLILLFTIAVKLQKLYGGLIINSDSFEVL